jgi:hypothetical protein
MLVIPLRLIHDLFDKMSFPVTNLNMRWEFLLSLAAGDYTPLVRDATGGDATIAIETQAFENQAGVLMYYRDLKFKPEVQARVATMLETNITKTFSYVEMEYYRDPNYQNKGVNDKVDWVISNSVILPLRVWLMLHANAPTQSNLAPFVTLGQLTELNIRVASQQYFSQNIRSSATDVHELYEHIRDNQIGVGYEPQGSSLLKYDDVLTNYRYHLLDISRARGGVARESVPVSLHVYGNRVVGNAGGCDAVAVVERLMKMQISMSKSDSSVIIGTNL